jgi:hypothetical protein
VQNEQSLIDDVYAQGTWPYMSAFLLQYPKKPNEVADDQESIVYVITECLLRWHTHSLSMLRPKDDDSIPLETWNILRGEPLRGFVASLFYEEIPLKDGYVGGGTTKLKQITDGAPSFKLEIPEGSAWGHRLNDLFLGLYKLLKEHYDAVPASILERFFVPKDAQDATTRNQYFMAIDAGEQVAPPMDEEDVVVDDPLDNSQQRYPTLKPSAHSSTTQPLLPQPTSSRRVLDTHGRVLQLFERYLYEPRQPGQRARFRLAPTAKQSDKTEDQFVGFNRLKTGSALSTSKRSHRSTVWESVSDILEDE